MRNPAASFKLDRAFARMMRPCNCKDLHPYTTARKRQPELSASCLCCIATPRVFPTQVPLTHSFWAAPVINVSRKRSDSGIPISNICRWYIATITFCNLKSRLLTFAFIPLPAAVGLVVATLAKRQ